MIIAPSVSWISIATAVLCGTHIFGGGRLDVPSSGPTGCQCDCLEQEEPPKAILVGFMWRTRRLVGCVSAVELFVPLQEFVFCVMPLEP